MLNVKWIIDPDEELDLGIITDTEDGLGVVEFNTRRGQPFYDENRAVAEHIVALHNASLED